MVCSVCGAGDDAVLLSVLQYPVSSSWQVRIQNSPVGRSRGGATLRLCGCNLYVVNNFVVKTCLEYSYNIPLLAAAFVCTQI